MALTDVFRSLATAIEDAAVGDPASRFQALVRWAKSSQASVEQDDRGIIIRFRDEGARFTVIVAPATETAARGAEREPSPASALATAINSGALKREIDAAVAWDPELAV